MKSMVVLFLILMTTATASAQQSPLLAIYNGEYAQAMRTGDAEKVNSFYADDAIILAPGAPPIIGRAAILKGHQNSYKRIRVEGTPTASEVSGDLGFVRGTYRNTWVETSNVQTGQFVEIWKRVNGQWKVYVDTWTVDRPQE